MALSDNTRRKDPWDNIAMDASEVIILSLSRASPWTTAMSSSSTPSRRYGGGRRAQRFWGPQSCFLVKDHVVEGFIAVRIYVGQRCGQNQESKCLAKIVMHMQVS
jgi:hypothetical protein